MWIQKMIVIMTKSTRQMVAALWGEPEAALWTIITIVQLFS